MQAQLSTQIHGTPSPNKRSTFRSKTKLKELGSTIESKLKTMPSFYVYVKDFPLDTPQQVISLVKTLQPTHINFLQNLQNLKLYKPQLSSLLEDSWAEFMHILRTVAVKLSKRGERLIEQKDRKIVELLKMNKELEGEQEKWKQRIDKLEHLRELEGAQLSMADTQLEIVNGEMRDIYQLLQGDMEKVSNYLTKLEARRAQQQQQGSSQIYSSLKSMSLLLANMENQQRSAGSTLLNMRQLIKAMTKCTKVSTSTQVDESELHTQAGAIFSAPSFEQQFHISEASSINLPSSSQPHLIDQLKAKEKLQAHDQFKLEKHAQKPWALTPTLLAFLQNMSKQNQAGKVLPWDYTRQVIREIYEQRISYDIELMSGGIGNGMLFDQFVVFFFIQKYRIRRLSEVKLLEFIISLKYYSRYWPKAQIFCQMMDVMRYQPLFQSGEGFNYQIDYNCQNFFFTVYKKLIQFDSVEEEGVTYIQVKQAKKLLKACLYFSEEFQRSRLLAKLDKDIRVFDKIQYCDLDWALSLMIDQYMASKKRICSILNRAFARKFQSNQGYFSLDEMKDLFSEVSTIYRAGQDMQYRYPIRSDINVVKLYLYTCTSGRNSYDLNVNNFISACQRYGFDAPFPFLHICKSKKAREEFSSQILSKEQSEVKKVEPSTIIKNEQVRFYQEQEVKAEGNLNKERVDIEVKIFSQHFSILRQLRSYVQIFTKTLKDQRNPEILWKSFEQIRQVLQKGCQFMRYPLLDQNKK